MSKLCNGWKDYINHLSDEDGRIILIWKNHASVRILSQSRQSLTCEVSIPLCPLFYYTVVYASNDAPERSDLWAELINLQQTYFLDTKPWFIGGDFNQIRSHHEHSLWNVNTNDSLMTQFSDCLLQLGVFDLRFHGPSFTWTNSQPVSPIAKKLDRLLVNNLTISDHPHATATFLPPLISDHCPCLIDLNHSLPTAGTKPFRFFNYLTKHPNFFSVASEAWFQAGSTCQTLANLCWKLKGLKNDLRALNKDNYSKIQERVLEANRLLQFVHVEALQHPSPDNFQKERDLHKNWMLLREIEESYFKQKSRINWLKEGDLIKYCLLFSNLSN